MNINGHEVERRDDGRMYVDGTCTVYGGDSDPDYYMLHGGLLRKEADHADLVAEFVRREQAEKAEQDAARELDRRVKLVADAWCGTSSDYVHRNHELICARNVVRALDADAAEKAT